jgi:hypothetical protein
VTQVLTAKDIEATAVAANGDRRLAVAEGVLVTPLARDRAAALGVTLVSANGRGPSIGGGPMQAQAQTPSNGGDLARLRAESVVRSVTRQVMLREGLGLGGLEPIVAAVLARLRAPTAGCGCGCDGSGGCR